MSDQNGPKDGSRHGPQGGPWSFPPAPQGPPPRRARLSPRVFIFLLLLASVAAGYWALTRLAPGQLSGADQGDALYLFGFLALVASGLVFARRMPLGVIVRNIAIWIAIAAVALLGYSYRDDLAGVALKLRGELFPAYAVSTTPHVLTVTQSDDGHFYVMGAVNGAPVRFAIDTGATDVVLAPADAQRAGVDLATLKFTAPTETANGVGYGAPYTVADFAVGPIRLSNVAMAINQAPMSTSLLGMSFLRRLDSFEAHGDQLILKWRG